MISFLASYLLQGFVNLFIGIIDSLILILHVTLISLNYPSNVINFFKGIFPFITFDILPTTWLYDRIFKFSRIEDSTISEIFNEVGYTNKSLSINNLGSIYIFFTFGPVIALLILLIYKYRLCRKVPKLQQRIDQSYKNTLKWKGVLVFCSETYLVICIVASIGIKDVRFGTDYSFTERYCSFISVFLAGYIILLPLTIAIVYFTKFKSSKPVKYNTDLVVLLGDEYINRMDRENYTERMHNEFIERYGALLEGYDYERLGARTTVSIILISMFRQLLYS